MSTEELPPSDCLLKKENYNNAGDKASVQNKGILLNKPCFFKQLNNLFFGNIFKPVFVVDVHEINFVIFGYKVGDNPCTARLTFAFGSNGHAYFMYAMAKLNTGIRLFFQDFGKFQ